MDASGLERTLLVEVGLRLYFGPPAGYLIGSNLGTNTLSILKSIDISPSGTTPTVAQQLLNSRGWWCLLLRIYGKGGFRLMAFEAWNDAPTL